MSKRSNSGKRYGSFAGINNVADPKDLAKSDLVDAVNIDLTDKGKPQTRQGYTNALSGDYSNMWSSSYRGDGVAFVQKGTALMQLTRRGGVLKESAIRSDLQLEKRMAYLHRDGVTYYTNGIIKGRVVDGVNYTWGVSRPSAIPTLTPSSGSYPEGMYQVAVTFIDDTGRESGASSAGTVVLPSTGGISVTNIPTNGSNMASVRVYLTGTNGDTLYHAKTVTHGTTSTTLTGGINAVPLETQFLSEPPAGDHLAMTDDGKMYIAIDSGIYITEPLRYHLVDLVKNWLPFSDRVNMLGAVNDGCFVGADNIYWIGNPDESGVPVRRKVVDDQAITGTMAYIDGDDIKGESKGTWLFFHGQNGIYLCGPGGQVTNIAADRVGYDEADSGAALVRTNNGMIQHLGVHKHTSGAGGNFRVSDLAEAEIIRNGINISATTITETRITAGGDTRVTASGDTRIVIL